MPFGLPRVPHVITIRALKHDRPVDVVFPASLRRRQDNLGRAPRQAVLAFNQRGALLRPPRNPHAIRPVFAQHGDIETGAVLASENGIVFVFGPAAGRIELHALRRGCADRKHETSKLKWAHRAIPLNHSNFYTGRRSALQCSFRGFHFEIHHWPAPSCSRCRLEYRIENEFVSQVISSMTRRGAWHEKEYVNESSTASLNWDPKNCSRSISSDCIILRQYSFAPSPLGNRRACRGLADVGWAAFAQHGFRNREGAARLVFARNKETRRRSRAIDHEKHQVVCNAWL